MGPEVLFQLLQTYRYWVLAPAPLFFGPFAIVAAGILIKLEFLEIIPSFLALLAGELTADLLWYWLGFRYGRAFVPRFGKYVGITHGAITYVKGLFGRRLPVIIFLSKLTGGFGFGSVIMFTCGLSHVPFWRYLLWNALAMSCLTTVFLFIGYFLGQTFLEINSIFGKITLGLLVAIIVCAVIGFRKYMRTKALESTNANSL